MSGGFGDGTCAEGHGVCCLFFTTTCSSSVEQNTSYIQNPGYPSGYSTTASTTCDYFIQKCEDSVCQVRLDFESLVMTDPLRTSTAAGPGAGTCVTDTLTMKTTSGDSFGPICGSETDSAQHIYLDVGTGGSDSVTLSFGTNVGTPTSTSDRFWSIRVMQIPCWTKHQAEEGCRQYLTGISGTVYSFNWNNVNSPQLLAGTYTVCIRREAGYCKLCWQAASDTNSFQTDSTIAAGSAGTSDCTTSLARVFIPDSNIGGVRSIATKDVYCGGALNPSYLCSVTSNKLVVDFVSPPAPVAPSGTGDTMRGFKLLFRQIPCNS